MNAALRSTSGNGIAKPAISVENLHKCYGEFEVLKGINFAAQEGEVISILGASGSGKSTFLRCLNLLEMPTSGQLQLLGEQVKLKPGETNLRIGDRKQVDRLRTEVAMVFQNFCLWSHMTILENLMEAPVHVQRRPRAEVRDEAIAVLKRVGPGRTSELLPCSIVRGPTTARGYRSCPGDET
nr:ATP-binding cassette domain-containing protein [Pseudomonas azotoformans]